MIVDAHQHFWDPAVADYSFLTDAVAPIRRRFGADDLEPLLRTSGVDGTVLVEARPSLDETRRLLGTAATTPFVLGVVGWVDLTDPNVASVLAELRALPGGERLVGVRHWADLEPDPTWLLDDAVQSGIAAVGDAGLVFDLLVAARNLPAALATARSQPRTRFVVDHLAKPPVGTDDLDAWAEGLAALAALPNVACKLSGLVNRGAFERSRQEEFVPYHRQALGWFGPERCMFGSDWPMCLLAADYETVLDLLLAALDELDERQRADVLGGTAVRTYGLGAPRRP